MKASADFLVIGGGSAGAVLASRLSQSGSHRVLLLEAGEDTPPQATPRDIDDRFPSSSLNPAYFWPGLMAQVTEDGPAKPFPQARIMGGGSSIMGMLALRGLPSDYERWRAAGMTDMSWQQALQYFHRFEGEGGYPVRPARREDWPGFVRAMQRAAQELGYPALDNANDEPVDGFFAMPNSQSEVARSSTARCYLGAEVRARSNLQILPATRVLRILFEASTAVGVEVESRGETSRLFAGKVIVCAGGIFSPALLMHSGVGPAAELERVGIAVVADLPGVGRNLQNHAYSFFSLTVPPGMRMPAAQPQFAVGGLRASSGLAGCPPGDLLLYMTGRVSARAFGTDAALVSVALYSPYSTGHVTLRSADPHALPQVNFRMLSDPRDPPRVVRAARLAEQLLREPAVAACYGEASLLPPALALAQFNRRGPLGRLFDAGAKAVLNGPRPIRRAAMRFAFPGARPLAPKGLPSTLTDADLLGAISPMGHPAGTCAIGRDDDPLAVLDADHRVRGTANLYVVDASAMPCVPAANTNLPTVMLAERAAQCLLAA